MGSDGGGCRCCRALGAGPLSWEDQGRLDHAWFGHGLGMWRRAKLGWLRCWLGGDGMVSQLLLRAVDGLYSWLEMENKDPMML